MALIINPNDPHNMFSKAGKITSEKFIIFGRKFDTRPIHRVQSAVIPKQDKLLVKEQQPFTKQLSRAVGNYAKIGCDGQPPCGYYNPKFSELDKAPHVVPDYEKTLIKTTPRPTMRRVQSAQITTPVSYPDRPRQKRDCFVDMKRQTNRKDVFFGQPMPHEERFNFLNVTTAFSKVPRTPQYSMDKSLSREQMTVYKRKHYAPDYEPNFEFGRKKLGSAGPRFDSKKGRDDIMTKPSEYTFEEYYEFDQYSRSPESQIYRVPTVPNFDKMIDRENHANNSKLPSYMHNKHNNTRMGLTHLSEKMLQANNYSGGRFQSVTTSFAPKQSQ